MILVLSTIAMADPAIVGTLKSISLDGPERCTLHLLDARLGSTTTLPATGQACKAAAQIGSQVTLVEGFGESVAVLGGFGYVEVQPAAPAEAPVVDSPMLSPVEAPDQFVLTGLEMGDASCYVRGVDPDGRSLVLRAEFALCSSKDLSGPVVATYKAIDVLADDCNGDPTCGRSQREHVIVGLEPIGDCGD